MKRKLIEINQEYLIVCDNENCDFKIKNPTGDPNFDSSIYINMACPQCGDNLLTEKDHLIFLQFMKGVNWVNKYFSWLTIFRFRRWKKCMCDDDCKNGVCVGNRCTKQGMYVHSHNGLHITDTKPQ
jgi:hypothetical protein